MPNHVALCMDRDLFENIKAYVGGGDRLRELGVYNVRYIHPYYRRDFRLGPTRFQSLLQSEWGYQVSFKPDGVDRVAAACAGAFDVTEEIEEEYHYLCLDGETSITHSPFKYGNWTDIPCRCGITWFCNLKRIICPDCREDIYLT